MNVKAAFDYIYGFVPPRDREEAIKVYKHIEREPLEVFSGFTVQVADWVKNGEIDKIRPQVLISMAYMWGMSAVAASEIPEFCKTAAAARIIADKMENLSKVRNSELEKILKEAKEEAFREELTPEQKEEQKRKLDSQVNVIFPKFGDK